jgi:hypothetical protein
LIDRIKPRAGDKEWLGKYRSECQKFVEYYHANEGRIDVSDPRLLISKRDSEYEYWEEIEEKVIYYKACASLNRNSAEVTTSIGSRAKLRLDVTLSPPGARL